MLQPYSQREGKGGKPGKTTISEAQLIGRGARYFPFVCEENDDRFRRKFDEDPKRQLRVLEELHYHSIDDSRYISELRTALVQEGMIDDHEIEKPLNLKESFKQTQFFASGLIYLNERIKNTNDDINSLADLGIGRANYTHVLAIGRGTADALLDTNDGTTEAGLGVLQKGQFRKLIADTVRAARDRSVELGKD